MLPPGMKRRPLCALRHPTNLTNTRWLRSSGCKLPGNALGQHACGMVVPVIRMDVRQEDGIHSQKFFDRHRQIDRWIADVAIGRATKAGKIPLGAKPWGGEKAFAGVVDDECGVSRAPTLAYESKGRVGMM